MAGGGIGARAAATGQLDDPNIAAAGLLYDMAALQSGEGSRLGYRRAAAAIVALPASVHELVGSGALEDVSLIGPASTRILIEFVREGMSPTVEAAIAASDRRDDVWRARRRRANFLSEYGKVQALAARLGSRIVRTSAYRGDFQMHSTWSDGGASLRAMAEGSLALGRRSMGITDHSHGLAVARGMSMARAAAQGREIDDLNAEYAGRFRIYKGVEANINADGSLDLSPDERRAFEYIVAAPHAALQREEDQTARLVAVVRAPGVAILGHPRGRMYGRRSGIKANWAKVFAEAAAHGVAVELDGTWHRQDLDWTLAAQALEAGCLFAADSDAHSVEELRSAEYAIAHARLAKIPASRVINCWPPRQLERWLSGR